MVALKFLSVVALAIGALAQGQFNKPNNAAAVLKALHNVDDATIKSGAGAAAYDPKNKRTVGDFISLNEVLRVDWQRIENVGKISPGFYKNDGAQAIIDYLNSNVGPDTVTADKIYTGRRDAFVQGGIIKFINPGLLQLREAVDGAAAAIAAKTPAALLTPMIDAFAKIQQNYASTQEFQEYGPGGAPS